MNAQMDPFNRMSDPTPKQVSSLESLSIVDELPNKIGSRFLNLTVPAAFTHGDDAVSLLIGRLQAWKWLSKRRIDLLTHAFHEAMVNAIMHGNRGRIEQNIEVELWADTQFFDLYITDQGAGFNQEAVQRAFQGRRKNLGAGRGIIIMLGIVDQLDYFHGGRCCRLRCRRSDIGGDGESARAKV
jgi:serine/threonine-protein kinase RsbW